MVTIQHLFEDYLTEPLFAGLGVLLGMAWYKAVARRHRPFEPTLWWLMRWSFVFVTVIGYVLNEADRLQQLWPRFHIAEIGAGMIITALFIILAFLDWRHACAREANMKRNRNSDVAAQRNGF